MARVSAVAGPLVLPGQPLEVVIPLEGDDLRARAQGDLRVVLDAPDQVARHALREALGAHEHVHALGRLREEHRRLAGRVAAPDDHQLLAGAELRLHERGAVVHAGPLEPRQARQGELPVLGARGDDHGARRDAGALVVDLDGVGLPAAGELLGVPRDHQPGPELLRLRVGARRQLLARDAGGEAEVVLDLRARARLAAGRARLQHQDVEPLRGAVDGGGQPRGAGADDHQVAEPALVDLLVEAEAVGDLVVRRVPEHELAAADQDGDVPLRDVEVVEQLLHPLVVVEIDVRVGMAVAGEELPRPQRRGAEVRSQEHHVADPVRDQLQPAEDERPHEDVAELGVGLHEREQALAVELDHLARLGRARPHERAAAGEHVDLAGELAGLMGGDERLGAAGRADDLEPSLDDHEERHVVVPDLHEQLALLDLAHGPMRRDPRDLRRRQDGEHLLGGGGQGRLHGLGHGGSKEGSRVYFFIRMSATARPREPGSQDARRFGSRIRFERFRRGFVVPSARGRIRGSRIALRAPGKESRRPKNFPGGPDRAPSPRVGIRPPGISSGASGKEFSRSDSFPGRRGTRFSNPALIRELRRTLPPGRLAGDNRAPLNERIRGESHAKRCPGRYRDNDEPHDGPGRHGTAGGAGRVLGRRSRRRAVPVQLRQEGSFLKGTTYRSHADFPGVSREAVFEKAAQSLAAEGWRITGTDKKHGLDRRGPAVRETTAGIPR